MRKNDEKANGKLKSRAKICIAVQSINISRPAAAGTDFQIDSNDIITKSNGSFPEQRIIGENRNAPKIVIIAATSKFRREYTILNDAGQVLTIGYDHSQN